MLTVTKPQQDNTALTMQVRRKPSFGISTPPRIPPRQKKHIVKVKFRLSWVGFQPNCAASGGFRIDQPYRIPAKSSATVPIAR